jgi:hypothetical protein
MASYLRYVASQSEGGSSAAGIRRRTLARAAATAGPSSKERDLNRKSGDPCEDEDDGHLRRERSSSVSERLWWWGDSDIAVSAASDNVSECPDTNDPMRTERAEKSKQSLGAPPRGHDH